MRRVIWSEPALDDLQSIVEYLEQQNPLAAQRVAAKLKTAAQSLDLFAERGRPLSRERRGLLSVKPYLIRYGIVGDEVRVLSVRHGARRPLP